MSTDFESAWEASERELTPEEKEAQAKAAADAAAESKAAADEYAAAHTEAVEADAK